MQTDVLKVTNYYDIIGVPMDATVEVIKARYRALSKSYHPDAGGSEAQMTQLNEAYRVLTNPLERAAFDRQLTRESTAATDAAARRKQAARWQQQATARAHQEARAQQRAYEETIFDTPAAPTAHKKRSAFWRFMAWGTAVYIVLGVGVIYFLTKPSTAATDSSAKPSDTSLSEEAAKASAAIPDSPDITNTSSAASNDETQNSTDTTPITPDESSSQTTTDNSTIESPTDQTRESRDTTTHKHNWRRLLPF